MSADDDWMLPNLGDLGDVKFAIAALRRELGMQRTSTGTVAADARKIELTEMERSLWDLIFVQAKLSAVLVQLLEMTTARNDGPLTREFLLDSILTQSQARADLDSLDEGWPW